MKTDKNDIEAFEKLWIEINKRWIFTNNPHAERVKEEGLNTFLAGLNHARKESEKEIEDLKNFLLLEKLLVSSGVVEANIKNEKIEKLKSELKAEREVVDFYAGDVYESRLSINQGLSYIVLIQDDADSKHDNQNNRIWSGGKRARERQRSRQCLELIKNEGDEMSRLIDEIVFDAISSMNMMCEESINNQFSTLVKQMIECGDITIYSTQPKAYQKNDNKYVFEKSVDLKYLPYRHKQELESKLQEKDNLIKELEGKLESAKELMEDVELTGNHSEFCPKFSGQKCNCMDRTHYNEMNNSNRAKKWLKNQDKK